MSIEAAQQWIVKLRDEPELLKSVESLEKAEERMELAKKNGFEFSRKELGAAAKSFQGELSDDDLDEVSGGQTHYSAVASAGKDALTGAEVGFEIGGPIGSAVCGAVGGAVGAITHWDED